MTFVSDRQTFRCGIWTEQLFSSNERIKDLIPITIALIALGCNSLGDTFTDSSESGRRNWRKRCVYVELSCRKGGGFNLDIAAMMWHSYLSVFNVLKGIVIKPSIEKKERTVEQVRSGEKVHHSACF